MNKCFRCGRKLKNSETTSGLEFCKVCEEYEQRLAKKDKEIKELRNRVAELEDKDWYELCIKQLEDQNNKLIKERDELRSEKQNVFGLIEQMEVKAIGVTKEKILAIRRQLCGEIRNAIEVAKLQHVWEGKELDISKILDKIEKGE